MFKSRVGETAEHLKRRTFLRIAGGLLAVPAATSHLRAAIFGKADPPMLPQVPFGPHTISRVVCGANPFNGGSHLSTFVNREMRVYYTLEQQLRTLRRCQEVGITLWQGSKGDHLEHRRFCETGGTMQYISLGKYSDPDEIKTLGKAGCIGIAHHGEVTDRLFKNGKLDEIHDYLKRVRAAGLQVGVSTHMPAVVDTVESKGWDIDFYMTCVYERHRTEKELKQLLGYVPLPIREVYLKEDPPRMFRMIQQTKRTCLAFKILAAGRLSDKKQWVEQAFRETFQAIKPQDAVIIGIYDRYSDQAAENADYTRRFSALSGKGDIS